MKIIFKWCGICIFIIVFLDVIGCTKKIYVPIEKEIVIKESVITKDTTILHDIEYIKDSVSIKDTVSYLSNKYASSFAAFSGGLLHHSLKTNVGDYLEIKVPQIEKETVKTERIEVPVYIDRKKTKKESFFYTFGIASLIIWVLAIVFCVFMVFKTIKK